MILPGRAKDKDKVLKARKLFWNDLWEQASKTLRNASEIAIIGYSLPGADQLARSLILRDSNKSASITICCGGDNVRIAKEFADEGFAAVKADSYYFEDWLKSV